MKDVVIAVPYSVNMWYSSIGYPDVGFFQGDGYGSPGVALEGTIFGGWEMSEDGFDLISARTCKGSIRLINDGHEYCCKNARMIFPRV